MFVHRREDESLIIKILDFGIAKLTEDIRRTSIGDATALKLTSTAGTPHYMAPEQAQGQTPGAPPIGPGSDIWAIGMMVFELLTGETYLSGDDPLELIRQLLYNEIEAPSKKTAKLPAKFDAWFLTSCDRDPAKRWSSTATQLTALASALGVAAIPASAPSSLTQAVNTVTPPTNLSYSFPGSSAPRIKPEILNATLAATQDISSANGPVTLSGGEPALPSGSDRTLDELPVDAPGAVAVPPPPLPLPLGDSRLHPRQGIIAAVAAAVLLTAAVLASRACGPEASPRSDKGRSPAAEPAGLKP